MPITLSSNRLTLDEPNAGDIDALYAYCRDPEILRWIPLPDPYEHIHAEYFITTFMPDGRENGTRAQWAIRQHPHEPLIGVIELLFQPMKSAEIGYWIAADYRGNGLMTEAIGTVADHVFDPAGRALTRLHWESMTGNTASARVARQVGFAFEGTARRSIVYHNERRDAWQASLLPGDARKSHDGWPADIG